MQHAQLDTTLRELTQRSQDRAVMPPRAATPRDQARILDHQLLEVRRGDPHAALGGEHTLDHLGVVHSLVERWGAPRVAPPADPP